MPAKSSSSASTRNTKKTEKKVVNEKDKTKKISKSDKSTAQKTRKSPNKQPTKEKGKTKQKTKSKGKKIKIPKLPGPEDALQTAAKTYLKRKYPQLIHCCSLAGIGKDACKKRARDMGYHKGWPDYNIPHGRGGYFGIFIEFKIAPNKPTKEQNETLEKMRQEGYLTRVVWNIEEFVILMNWYMALPKTVGITDPKKH